MVKHHLGLSKRQGAPEKFHWLIMVSLPQKDFCSWCLPKLTYAVVYHLWFGQGSDGSENRLPQFQC